MGNESKSIAGAHAKGILLKNLPIRPNTMVHSSCKARPAIGPMARYLRPPYILRKAVLLRFISTKKRMSKRPFIRLG
jgi:hypothetical protein